MTDDEEPPMDEADTSALQTPSGEKIKEPDTRYRSQAAGVPGPGSVVRIRIQIQILKLGKSEISGPVPKLLVPDSEHWKLTILVIRRTQMG